MATLRIPRSQFSVLKKFSELDAGVVSTVIESLEKISAELQPVTFVKHLAENIKTIPEEDLTAYLKVLMALYGTMNRSKRTAAQIASDVRETMIEEKVKDFSPDKAAILEDRISKILSVGGSLAVTAKAGNLMTDYARVVVEVQIISDIRPIFGENPNDISAGLVVHTLKLGYREDGDQKHFYCAMDNADLGLFKMAIERAEVKAKSLTFMIQKSGVKHLKEGE